ncbi:MAG: hypothetical protein CW349_07950 [Firmicutes bacterium]|nr:hypothetical protein [Bacillota bacterium]
MGRPRLVAAMVIIFTLGLAWSGLAHAQAASGWQAGAAVFSIAPRSQDLEDGLSLGGYDGGRVAVGIHTPITARALALTAGAERLLLLVLDLPGFDQELSARIRAEAATATGWPQDRIWVAATHTHAAPDLLGLWGGAPDGYRTLVRERAVAAAQLAVERLEPVELAMASFRARGLGENRRGWAFTDETLSLLVARRPGGPVVATLINAGIPPRVLGPENRWISPDWVGSLRAALEEWHGGTAFFLTGAGGDVVPAAAAEGFHGAMAFGIEVARRVDEALQGLLAGEGAIPWRALEPHLRVSVAELVLPVQSPAVLEAVEAGRVGYRLGRTGDLVTVTTWVGRATFGRGDARAEALTIPGEVVTRMGIQIRGLMHHPDGFIFSLTHDTLGVFLSWDEWMTGRHGHDEEAHSLGINGGVLLYQALSALP